MISNQITLEIKRLKLEGFGPKAIADQLGISVNTVKSFIRRHTEIQTTHPCRQCGKGVEQTPGRKEKKFCSDRCRMQYWNNYYRGGNKDGNT